MRAGALTLGRVAVLAGPAAIAFFTGGFFDSPRLVAGLVAWVLLAALVLAGVPLLPTGRPGRIVVAGLGLLAALTALSIAWSPLPGTAYHDLQRLVLYLGALLLAAAVLRGPAARWVEPALAGGAVVVIGWGLADRLLPGLFMHAFSFAAGGRLDQPLTYWNGMGELAALGLVLCARLAGTTERPPWMRGLAAAATPLLGAGLYLTFSRGAVVALGASVIVLLAAAPTWPQVRGIGVVAQAALIAALAASAFPALATYNEEAGTREWQGAAMLAVLVVLGVASGWLAAWSARGERDGRLRRDRLPVSPRRAGLAAAVGIALAGAAFVALAARDTRPTEHFRATPGRFASAQTHRFEYWRVAVRAWGDHPVAGTGSGGFRVEWLRERPIRESARNAHSLYLETAAELGLLGLAALGLFVAGVALAAREALRRAPVAAVGPVAAVALLAFHAGIDWDWQIPAVTLPTLTAIGALVAWSESWHTVGRG